MKIKDKIIGTLVPLNALSSLQVKKKDQGTLAVGIPFLEWLQQTNQSAWQLLPLHETELEKGSKTKHIPSPYKSYGIGLDQRYLPISYANLKPTKQQKEAFILQHATWIHDYTLFCALRDHFGTDDWREWEEDIKAYKHEAVVRWTEKLTDRIDTYLIIQWQLHEAYTTIRKKAKELGIWLIGDLPFYPSFKSPLVWAYQDVFQINVDGTLPFVSGIPDINKTFFGRQIWGHPLYNWDHAKEKVISFWKMRLLYQAELFDSLRFDHVRGFFVYGMIDVLDKNNDREVNGPGAEVFSELAKFSQENGLWVFAEDDDDPPVVKKSLEKFHIAGVKIFRFALEEKEDMILSEYAAIAEYPPLTVSYSTTHDTESLLGYLKMLSVNQKQRIAHAAHLVWDKDDNLFAKNILDALLLSPAQTIIIPIQDWLLITDRINIPGTEKAVNDPNWHFTLKMPIEELPVDVNTSMGE